MIDVDKVAGTLAIAARDAQAVPQISKEQSYSLEAAYRIQRKLVSLRPGPRVGAKMGFTSKAKMVQMGVDDLICGELTEDMRILDGGDIDLSKFVHPRAEPEIAYLLADEISGPITPANILNYVVGVAVAIEIIDSRYKDFAFSLEDVVADNASSSGFVVGAWHDPKTDVRNAGITMSINGRPRQFGSAAAILGDPARAVTDAARLATQTGIALKAGSIILAGAATAAEAIEPGCVISAEASGLGKVSFSVGAA